MFSWEQLILTDFHEFILKVHSFRRWEVCVCLGRGGGGGC